jgi:hypothetical protein
MKLSSVFAIYLSATTTVFAAGTVHLTNLPQFVGDSNGQFYDRRHIPLDGTNYLAQIYAGINAAKLVPVGPTVTFFSGSFAGYFGRGIGFAEISFVSGYGPAWIQVRAWESEGGTSFEQAARSGYWTGVSDVLFIKQTGSSGITPSAPAELIGLRYPGSPIIVVDPQNQKRRSGESAELSMVASGGIALSYQWYQGGSGDTNQPVVGATNAIFQTPVLATNVTFWAKATTAVGSANSGAALVTVFPASSVFLDIGIVDGTPQLAIDLPTAGPVEVQSWDGNSSMLWKVLSTVVPSTNPLVFVDSSATNGSARFYRAVKR